MRKHCLDLCKCIHTQAFLPSSLTNPTITIKYKLTGSSNTWPPYWYHGFRLKPNALEVGSFVFCLQTCYKEVHEEVNQ